MKSIIALTLIIALGSCLNLSAGKGTVDFEFDPMDNSLFGLVMKGSIDPKNELNNKISTFLKLANTYIPVLESLNNEGNNLKWWGSWLFDLGPLGTIGVTGSFNLVVGWNVYVNSSMDPTLGTYLDVTYVPFAWGWTDANLTLSNYLAMGVYNATLYYARTYVAISLNIFQGGQVCYMGNAYFWPVQLVTNLSSSLVSCQDEIIANVLAQTPITFMCNASVPFNMTHLNISFTQNMTSMVVNQSCVNL